MFLCHLGFEAPRAERCRAKDGLALETRELTKQGHQAQLWWMGLDERAHQGIGNERFVRAGSIGDGAVQCTERLGGLLKCYRRVA